MEPARAPQGFRFALALGSLGPRGLRVVRVRGREEVSKPYRWEVLFSVDEPTFDAAAVLGQPAHLSITTLAGKPPRTVLGVVDHIRAVGASDGGHCVFRVRIVPRLALLALRRQSRIFQDATIPDIVRAVLDGAGVPHQWATRSTYPARGYCVQYEETDLDLVARLCGEAGIFYRFDVPEDAGVGAVESVVFGDSVPPELEGGARLVLRASLGSALAGEEAHVTRFAPRSALTPRAYAMRGWDFRRPTLVIEATEAAERAANEQGDGFEVYEHHEPDETTHAAESGLMRAHVEQLTRGTATARGASLCARMASGRRFVLDQDGDESAHVLLRVEHEGRAPHLAGELPTYENRFTCAPASWVPRPAKPRRAVRQVSETAIVVGPPGQEIHTDEHGRIEVRFHWDRESGLNEHASCWVRVAQAWAGDAWRAQFIPRVGMEVLVTFIGGDPNRPIVVGCVPNALHPPPFVLPGEAPRSGIRTRSTPRGDGFNELSFTDAKGGELVRLRAERDFATLAQHDHAEVTGNDRAVEVGHDRTTTIVRVDALEVGERLSTTVAGSAFQEMSDQKIAHATGGGASMSLASGDAGIKAKGDVSIEAGGNVTIDAAGNIHLKAGGAIVIEAAGAVTILGASITAKGSGAVLVAGSTVDLNP